MRVTLEEFFKLNKEDQAKVTHLDLICDGDIKRYWHGSNNKLINDYEEYEGEEIDRGLINGFNR